jgi:hypothetical protein
MFVERVLKYITLFLDALASFFHFRIHLAIFSIKAWNNIRRVVPPRPPLFSDPIYVHICGGGLGPNISCLPSITMQNVLLQILFTSNEVFCNHLSIHLICKVPLLFLLAKEQKERLGDVGLYFGCRM